LVGDDEVTVRENNPFSLNSSTTLMYSLLECSQEVFYFGSYGRRMLTPRPLVDNHEEWRGARSLKYRRLGRWQYKSC